MTQANDRTDPLAQPFTPGMRDNPDAEVGARSAVPSRAAGAAQSLLLFHALICCSR